jgi:hypothetical protein
MVYRTVVEYVPIGWVLLTLALYQTSALAEPLVAVVLMVNGEPLDGIAAYVRMLGTALARIPDGPTPKPPSESTRQPQVPFTRATGEPVVPAEALIELPPLTMSVVVALFSSRVIVRPAVSFVAAEMLTDFAHCIPIVSGVIAAKVTVGPVE